MSGRQSHYYSPHMMGSTLHSEQPSKYGMKDNHVYRGQQIDLVGARKQTDVMIGAHPPQLR